MILCTVNLIVVILVPAMETGVEKDDVVAYIYTGQYSILTTSYILTLIMLYKTLEKTRDFGNFTTEHRSILF